jgi:hypothetical protein
LHFLLLSFLEPRGSNQVASPPVRNYADFSEAMSIEKRYFTSDLMTRS